MHDEPDCVEDFGRKLVAEGVLTEGERAETRDRYAREALDALHQVRREPYPDPATVFDHVFA